MEFDFDGQMNLMGENIKLLSIQLVMILFSFLLPEFQKRFAEVQSPLLGDFFPKNCPTVNTTTEAWLKKKGGWWDINFNNPPLCIFPFNYKGDFFLSLYPSFCHCERSPIEMQKSVCLCLCTIGLLQGSLGYLLVSKVIIRVPKEEKLPPRKEGILRVFLNLLSEPKHSWCLLAKRTL